MVQSLVSGYAIHLRISLSEAEGDPFMGALGLDRMEGEMEVVDAEFRSRD